MAPRVPMSKSTFRMAIKRPRIVKFSLEEHNTKCESNAVLQNAVSLTQSCCDPTLWYKNSEIAAFKKEVGNILLFSKDKEDFYGLERHNLKRSKAKKKTINLIIKLQGRGPDFLRRLSHHATRPARNMAFVQGIRDFCAAYDKSSKIGADSNSLRKSKTRIAEYVMEEEN